MRQFQTFETDRLKLIPTSAADAAFVLELLNTPKWHQYIGDRNVKSLEDAAAYIKNKMELQLIRLGFSNYTVVRKEDGAKLGSCGLYDRQGLDGIDIGFAFLPQFEKKGYAYESALKLKEAAIEQFGIKTIQAITTKENTSSQRLLEKLGFAYIEIVHIPGDEEELMLYRFKAEES